MRSSPNGTVARFVRRDGKIATKVLQQLAPVVALTRGDFGEPFEPPIHPSDLISFRRTQELHGEQPVYREAE